MREWGRLGQRDRRRLDLFAGRVQAVEALEAWLVRKARRGYVRRNSTASVNRPVHRESPDWKSDTNQMYDSESSAIDLPT